MCTVEGLHARIAHISADIEMHTEVLRQLEKSKSLAQGQLNALRDPLARLPVEISSEIFLECLPSRIVPNPRTAPMLLLNICNAWTNIALSTPALWAAIHLDGQSVQVLQTWRQGPANASRGTQVLQTWLPRAQNCTLSVSLRNSLNHGVAGVLGQYAQQLRHLELYGGIYHVYSLTSLPALEKLTIGSERGVDTVHLTEIMKLLRLTPNLVECDFVQISINPSNYAEHKLTMPSLRCLKFGDPDTEDLYYHGDAILNHLTLPALKTLVVSLRKVSYADFSLFLKRSLPPLRRLALGSRNTNFQFTHLDEFLRLLPLLTHVELQQQVSELEIFSALADPESLLPNLRSLKIRSESTAFSASWFPSLLRALSARRSQLVYFQFESYYQPEANEDVYKGLRKLIANGMEIRIGYQEKYISFQQASWRWLS
ncbi:hypothetical protein DFH08DRAFT_872494 [Mycena albidolilacea]|uniref:F-box domain-containing protein n=1 Tax=Mycena albidolilacea TaxID=1033008 RepID=A0AAD7EQS1_9AGAR|nr:hypothetical protein DFH08DRAFT_872494 [Mycena albidolilacea]